MEEYTLPQVEAEDQLLEEQIEEQIEEQKEAFALKVKYNGEEMELDEEKAREAAQKGLNYDKELARRAEVEQQRDRIKQELEALKSSHLYKLGEAYQRETGKASIDEAGKELYEARMRLLDAKRAEQDGVTVEQARERRLYEERRKELEQENKNLEKTNSELTSQQEQMRQAQADLAEFKSAFPGVEIPVEGIKEYLNQGIRLLPAYRLYQLDQQEAKAKEEREAAEANAKNADTTPGRLGGQDGEHLAELTEEQIMKMTPQELEKNHSKIWAKLTGKKG